MKKKLISVFLTAVTAAGMLAGCGNAATSSTSSASSSAGASEEESTTAASSASQSTTDSGAAMENEGRTQLTFWSWWSSDARKPFILELVDNYNKSQDKYFVTYVDVPWDDIFTKNIAAIAAGNPCDIMANNMEEVKFRASQGQVTAIDQYVDQSAKDGFYSQYIDACTGDDGSLYALPFSVDTRCIYYNVDQFEEAGIDASEIKTWEDLEKAAHKLDVKDGDSYSRVGFMPLLGNGGLDTWLINANKGQCYFDTDTLKGKINSDINKKVFAWVRGWIDYYGQDTFDELSSAFSSGMADPFASGTMSMVVNTSAYQAALAKTAPDLNYGIFLMPEYSEGNGNTVNGGGFVLEVPAGAKNPEGSVDFIKFATSYEQQDFLCTNMGDFSARNDFPEDAKFFQKPHIQDISQALKQTSTMIVPNAIKGYQDVINPYIEEGTLGQISTDEALDQAEKAFDDFVASNQ